MSPRRNRHVESSRPRLTYANVVATLALFVALGGSSYAALKISGREIQKHTITGQNIKRNSLGRRQIKESSLSAVPRALNAASSAASLPKASWCAVHRGRSWRRRLHRDPGSLTGRLRHCRLRMRQDRQRNGGGEATSHP